MRARGVEQVSTCDDIGAVIVNFNSGNELITCIRSIRSEGVNSIVVVDNGSTDDSIANMHSCISGIQVVEQANLGFGRGVNAGVALLHNKYVLSLNPDATLHRGSLRALCSVLETDEHCAIAGPLIVGTDGQLYPSARRFPRITDAIGHAVVGVVKKENRWTRRYKRADEDYSTQQRVDWLSGSAMLIRKQAFDEIAGFSPNYFMYFEDVDLCWRLKKNGHHCIYVPSATVTHIGGTSTAKAPLRMQKAHHISAMRYAMQTTRGAERLLLPAIAVGLLIRFIVTAMFSRLRATRFCAHEVCKIKSGKAV